LLSISITLIICHTISLSNEGHRFSRGQSRPKGGQREVAPEGARVPRLASEHFPQRVGVAVIFFEQVFETPVQTSFLGSPVRHPLARRRIHS
jgi:hypothetical protein